MGDIDLGKLGTEAGPLELTAASIEDTYAKQEDAFGAGVTGTLPCVLLGASFDGNAATAMRIIKTPLVGLGSVLEFTPSAGVEIVALIVPGPNTTKVFVACEVPAGTRWVDIAQMHAFYALPQPTRKNQRDVWIKRLAEIPKGKWPAGLDLSALNLGKLGSPILRLLVAVMGESALSVSGVNQPDKGFRGGQTKGVTLPLFDYPLEEPGCYLRVIAGREGVLESINAYDQGAGISLGPIQFNAQRAAILKFTRALDETDRTLFASTLGAAGMSTALQGGLPEITVTTAAGSAVTLRGDGSTKQVGRTVAYFQSQDPDRGTFAQINATWRKSVAARFRDAVVWPHVQTIVEDISSNWLADGLSIVDAAIPAIDKRRPDRDTFVLRALLLSAYVRFSASLRPLLHALQPFATPAAKLGAISNVLRDTNTAWPKLSFARRKALAIRLEDQDDDAIAVWETIIKLADSAGTTPTVAPALKALMAKPIVIADEDLDFHDGLISSSAVAPANHAAILQDKTVAIPPFTDEAKAAISQPLLGASSSATAIAWNTARHPQISGVSVNQIAEALESYVDIAAVGAALGAVWSGRIDAVFVEAVHQFQSKVFAEKSDHDGRAGEASLDALGLFFGRPGLNGVDVANIKAQNYLSTPEISGALAGASDNPDGPHRITASNWFQQMMQASFLGYKFSNGVHVALVRRLRLAERHLLSLGQYQGMTPVELGIALGIRESHKGSRPTANTASMHTMGLATDINYVGNPWLKGAQFTTVLRRAALLVDGAKVGSGKAAVLFFSLSGRPTTEIYDTLASWNRAFKAYLALRQDAGQIKALLAGHKASGTAGVFEPANETVEHATQRWQGQIAADLQSLDGGDGFSDRDPKAGFLDLHRDLVLALRDHGCLAWGAIDFGPGDDGSGDVMHFDCRSTGIGRIVNRGFPPKERQCS